MKKHILKFMLPLLLTLGAALFINGCSVKDVEKTIDKVDHALEQAEQAVNKVENALDKVDSALSGDLSNPKDIVDALLTNTPAPTEEAASTPTAKPTATQAPTNTPKPTATQAPTNTPKPTATQAPTNTPKPTATQAPTNTPKPTKTPTPVPTKAAIDEKGTYCQKDDVALYIHTYGKLPSNYVTKKDAEAKYGWSGGALDKVAKGKSIGGDKFGNYEKLLPTKSNRTYYECDIDTEGRSSRGTKRIIFSNDGLVYYTEDHYETFTLLYGTP